MFQNASLNPIANISQIYTKIPFTLLHKISIKYYMHTYMHLDVFPKEGIFLILILVPFTLIFEYIYLFTRFLTKYGLN